MWNYDFIIPSLIVLSVYVLLFFSYKRIPIKLNKTFLALLILEMMTILVNIYASKSLEEAAEHSLLFLKAINVTFFILFLLRGFLFFIFTCAIFKIKISSMKELIVISMAIFFVSEMFVLANFFYPTIFSVTNGRYIRTEYYNTIYICTVYLSIISIFISLMNKSKVSERDFIISIIFNTILLIGYILRIKFSNYLIMDTFCILAIIIIYQGFENQYRFLDERTTLFNRTALQSLLSEMTDVKPPFILGFVIQNYTELREIYTGSQMDKTIMKISNHLTKTYPELYSFYIRDGRFILVGKNIKNGVKIRKEISDRFSKSWDIEENVTIFLDVGFIKVSQHLEIKDSDMLINVIINAMHSIEQIGSTNVMISEETIKKSEQTTEIKRAVEHAVENNAVELFLQPLIDVNTFKVVGAEALARIRDSNNEIIPPGLFIPIAEQNGRIDLMGEQIFEKTCLFIQNHDITKMGLSWINVNLSPIQFLHKDLNERFSRILSKYDVPVHMIHLEITEESMIDYALLQKQIHIMKHSGFQFVLDDYGSGYSNVTRLKKCPFINVKLDMEIVWDYFKTKDKILPTLVETFKQMNFSVTAEGIESIEMAEALKEIGCDYLQGFYFSKPIPAEEFAKKYGETK